jgi:PAS domain S-box-containing protein
MSHEDRHPPRPLEDARLERLRRVATTVGLDVDDLCRELLEAAVAVSGADAGALHALDPGDGGLRLVASHELDPESVAALAELPADMATAVLDAGRIVVEDATQQPELAGAAELRGSGLRSLQAMPLVGRDGNVVGVLSTHRRAPHAPTAEELLLLDLVARQAADVLERERWRADAEANRERLEEVLEAASMAVWEWTPELDVAESSGSLFEVFGLSPGETPVGRAMGLGLVHPDDREPHRAAVEAGAGGAGWHHRFRIVRPRDGQVAWLEERAVARLDPVSGRTRVLGLVWDVTERQQAEEVLRAAEARERFVLELTDRIRPLRDPLEIRETASRLLGEQLACARVGYWEIGEDSSSVLSRCAWAAASGAESIDGELCMDDFGAGVAAALRRGEVVVMDDCDRDERVGAESRATWAAIGARAAVAYPLVRQGQLVAAVFAHDQGPRRWTDDDVALVAEAGERTSAAAERVRTEEALRESEERFRSLVVPFAQATWETDAVGSVVQDSASWRAYTGQSVGEWLGDGWTDAFHPDDREAMRAIWHQAMRRRTPVDAEFRLRMASGGWRWTNIRAAPLVGPTGAIEKWFGMNIDVTPRLEAEAAVLAERQRQDELQREFVANAAHELRTPLTAIVATVEALSQGASESPEHRERFLVHLSREAGRLNRLSDSLLLLAQVESGRGVPRLPVRLVDLLTGVAEQARAQAVVPILVHVAGDLLIDTNEGLLERAVGNLTDNAAKHTIDGEIELSATRFGDTVAIEVRDTGPGLSADVTDRAFDRFYRGAERAADGFGLGLSIASQVARALDASLVLDSAPGGGTIARLSLRAQTPL